MIKVSEDLFLVDEEDSGPEHSWKCFVLENKFKWPSLGSFINLEYVNEFLAAFHLCFHAPKLDSSVGLNQLLAALFFLPAKLIDKELSCWSRLAEVMFNLVV